MSQLTLHIIVTTRCFEDTFSIHYIQTFHEPTHVTIITVPTPSSLLHHHHHYQTVIVSSQVFLLPLLPISQNYCHVLMTNRVFPTHTSSPLPHTRHHQLFQEVSKESLEVGA